MFTLLGQISNGGPQGTVLSLHPADDPVEHSDVLSESRPQELAVVVHTEPVHVEDLGHLNREVS